MDPEEEQDVRNEAEIMRSLSHPNVVRLLDFIEADKFFYLVMELMEGGELFERIIQKSHYTERSVPIIFNCSSL